MLLSALNLWAPKESLSSRNRLYGSSASLEPAHVRAPLSGFFLGNSSKRACPLAGGSCDRVRGGDLSVRCRWNVLTRLFSVPSLPPDPPVSTRPRLLPATPALRPRPPPPRTRSARMTRVNGAKDTRRRQAQRLRSGTPAAPPSSPGTYTGTCIHGTTTPLPPPLFASRTVPSTPPCSCRSASQGRALPVWQHPRPSAPRFLWTGVPRRRFHPSSSFLGPA